jgi:hypothetical protein
MVRKVTPISEPYYLQRNDQPMEVITVDPNAHSGRRSQLKSQESRNPITEKEDRYH